MRACVQRVSSASVVVDNEVVGEIQHGLVVLLGVADDDSDQDVKTMVDKVLQLRIFPDDDDKMNRSLLDCHGELLVVSQFTLMGDARKGRRPSFVHAASPETGNQLYETFCQVAREQGVTVATGIFQADMKVSLVNDGPVTILLDTKKVF